MKALALLTMALSLCVGAPAAEPSRTRAPFELQGVKPKMTTQEVDALYPDFSKYCRKRPEPRLGTTSCWHSIPREGSDYATEREKRYPTLVTFAGQRIHLFNIDTMDDVVHAVWMSMPTSGWPSVTAALREKYGEPSVKETAKQLEWTWRDGDLDLVARREAKSMYVKLGSEEMRKKEIDYARERAGVPKDQ